MAEPRRKSRSRGCCVNPGMIAIPKASNEKHVRDNARSIDIKLAKEDFADLDREFPPPKSKKPLPML